MTRQDQDLRLLHIATRAREIRGSMGLPVPGEHESREMARIRLTPPSRPQLNDLFVALRYNYDAGSVVDEDTGTAVVETRTLPLLVDLKITYRRMNWSR